jgi:Fe-S-cluster-containing dehydrogenase component
MQKCDMCINEKGSSGEDPPCVRTCPTDALALMKMDERKKKETEKSMVTVYSFHVSI